jgi:hypothetical protein
VRGKDNALWTMSQTAPGGSWSGWTSLGGILMGAPVAARNEDGHLEVFARGTDNALYNIWQKGAGGPWSNWASLGGTTSYDPTVGLNQDGRLMAVVRGADNALYQNSQTKPSGGTPWSGWSGF